MQLAPYVEHLRAELASVAALGGDDTRALAERLTGPLESAFRLALLDALGAAAEEITRELAPGAVELRLRGQEPGFVVTSPPATPAPPDEPPTVDPVASPPETEEGATTRITFRLPEHLKNRIEETAGREGLSVNAWLVRAATAAVTTAARPDPRPRAPRGGQRYTGWAR
ncbi:hypothetical protein O7606_00675 [Micromonospora sp. WMMD882]|uniref:hypothetical protein n=1 Tax=Micromonospora sp. WMMD882 TaxID=3015151 RepID=UPI00248D1D5D|nr:hypothetical protein [Micromonospora sp. WMMD882]WBB79957.1 hypothetical protein O7606_00675 [Micromonospora sp. WMMD882]